MREGKAVKFALASVRGAPILFITCARICSVMDIHARARGYYSGKRAGVSVLVALAPLGVKSKSAV